MTLGGFATGFEMNQQYEWDDGATGSTSGPSALAAMTGAYGARVTSDGVEPRNHYQYLPGFAVNFVTMWSFGMMPRAFTGDVQLFGSHSQHVATSGGFSGRYRQSDGKLIVEARLSDGSVDDTLVGPTLVMDQRYDVEMLFHGSNHPSTKRMLTVVVDGVEIGTLGPNTGYLGSWNAWAFGENGLGDSYIAPAFTCDFDDVLVAWATDITTYALLDASFPMGPIVPMYFAPTGVGTHVGTGSFTASTGTLANSWQLIDELPWPVPSVDYVQQETIATGDYLEYTFDDITLDPDETIAIAAVFANLSKSGTGTPNSETHVVVDGTDQLLHDGGENGVSDPWTVDGIGGNRWGAAAWDAATFNDIVLRWGYSSDVTPKPRLETATIIVALTTPPEVIPEPPVEVPGSIGDDVYYDQLGFIDSTEAS